jgi:hypothetical protein
MHACMYRCVCMHVWCWGWHHFRGMTSSWHKPMMVCLPTYHTEAFFPLFFFCIRRRSCMHHNTPRAF